MIFLFGRIDITFNSISSKSLNSEVFAQSCFQIAIGFANISSTAANARKFINNVRT